MAKKRKRKKEKRKKPEPREEFCVLFKKVEKG